MEQPSTKDKVILIAATAALIGWYLFRNKIKSVLKEKAKDLTAEMIGKDLNVSKAVTHSAAGLIID